MNIYGTYLFSDDKFKKQFSELSIDNTTLQNGGSRKAVKSSRSFKVKLDVNGELYGRYNGDSPYQAANKALSEIIRSKVKNNDSLYSRILLNLLGFQTLLVTQIFLR